MSSKIRSEIALYVGVVVAALEAVNAELIHPPAALRIVLAVVIAVAGALKIRASVTPFA
jgi:hypothetical protein